MAVALRGYTQGSIAGTGYSVAWPAGTVAGDVALVACSAGATDGPQATGWNPLAYFYWWKVLTSADIASALVVNGAYVMLQTFSGSAGIGSHTKQSGLTLGAAGSGLWVTGTRSAASLAPATYRLGTEWTDAQNRYRAAYFMAVAAAGYQALPSAASDASWDAIEVLPASVPAAPTLLSPGSGEHVAASATQTFSWQHQSTAPQTGYRLQVQWTDGGGVLQWRWRTPAGAWTNAETDVPSTVSSLTDTPPTGTEGRLLTWLVATQSATGWGPYSTGRTLYADIPPTVATPTVTSPAGSLAPSVAWSASAGTSNGVVTAASAHRTRITPATAATPDEGTLWDSGLIANTTSPDVAAKTSPWTNGESLKAWVTAYIDGGVSHTAASAAFTVTWTAPAAPTIAATAGSPVQVTVSGLTSGSPVQVEQQLGGVWSLLAAATASGTTLTVTSVLAATGSPVALRARQASVVDGVSLWSAWSATASVTATLTACYLVDDADRTSALAVSVRRDTGRGLVQGVATAYGLGATSARVDYTPTAGQRGGLIIATDSPSGRKTLTDWLDAHRVWWLALPPDKGNPNPAVRCARASDMTWERLAQTTLVSVYDVALSWVEQ